MAHTTIVPAQSDYLVDQLLNFHPAKDWEVVQPTLTLHMNSRASISDIERVDQDLKSHMNRMNTVKHFNDLTNAVTTKPKVVKDCLSYSQILLSKFTQARPLDGTLGVVSSLAQIGKAVGVFKGTFDLLSLSFQELSHGGQLWKNLTKSGGKMLGIFKGTLDLLSLGITEHSGTFTRLSSSLSILSSPFVGIQTYKSVNEAFYMHELGRNISFTTREEASEESLKDFGRMFLKRTDNQMVTAWTYHKDNTHFIQESLNSDEFFQLVNGIVQLENNMHLQESELKKLQEIAGKTASSIQFSSYTQSGFSVFGALAASYGTGAALIGSQLTATGLAGSVATIALSTLTGAAFIAGTAYAGYLGYEYLFNNSKKV